MSATPTTSIPQRTLGGTAKGLKVGNIGHGLMLLTWTARPPSDEEAFESMKAAVDAGATYWDAGNFYGTPDPLANMKLLSRFFDKYPEYAEPGRIFLSVKGGVSISGPGVQGSIQDLEYLRKDLQETVATLGSRKKIDLFQVARQLSSVEITIPALRTLIEEGFFNHIGLSEVSAATLRKAHAIYPIATVEVEASLWALEKELYDVIKTSEKLGVTVIGYSPLGRGFIVGKFKSRADMPDDDVRKTYPKFSEQNFPINVKIADTLSEIARNRAVPVPISQLALAYLLQMSPNLIPIPGSTNTQRTLENIAAGNVTLTREDITAIEEVISKFPSPGERYPEELSKLNWL